MNIIKLDQFSLILGRSLLGLYFLIPGLAKIFNYSDTLILMESKDVPLAEIALPLTILIQVIFSSSLILNKYLRISSLILATLTVLINIYIHDFWNLIDDHAQGHELQNFIKNLAIMAGLIILSTKEKTENY
jgi:putative oxidoreductase